MCGGSWEGHQQAPTQHYWLSEVTHKAGYGLDGQNYANQGLQLVQVLDRVHYWRRGGGGGDS